MNEEETLVFLRGGFSGKIQDAIFNKLAARPLPSLTYTILSSYIRERVGSVTQPRAGPVCFPFSKFLILHFALNRSNRGGQIPLRAHSVVIPGLRTPIAWRNAFYTEFFIEPSPCL